MVVVVGQVEVCLNTLETEEINEHVGVHYKYLHKSRGCTYRRARLVNLYSPAQPETNLPPGLLNYRSHTRYAYTVRFSLSHHVVSQWGVEDRYCLHRLPW